MSKTITLALRAEDAEPILRQAAYNAAKYGAWCDFFTRKTVGIPAGERPQWTAKFLEAKRVVEAFGVEYEATTEPETMGLYYPYVGGKRINRGFFNEIVGGKPDYKNPLPQYRAEIHAEACRQACERVVRRWRQSLELAEAA